MEVHFTPEQEAQLAQIATKAGTDPEHLVKDAVLRPLQDEIYVRKPAPELPVWRLGAIGSLHRRDIYNDVRRAGNCRRKEKEPAMSSKEFIDWSDCALVETKQGVQGGAPVLRGTRMPASAIIANFDYGVSVDEIAEQFELPADQIQALVAYAQSHRIAHPV